MGIEPGEERRGLCVPYFGFGYVVQLLLSLSRLLNVARFSPFQPICWSHTAVEN